MTHELRIDRLFDAPPEVLFDSSLLMVDDDHTVETTVTVAFEGQNGKTLPMIVPTGFEREEDRDGIQGGWPGILDTLEHLVVEQRAEELRGGDR